MRLTEVKFTAATCKNEAVRSNDRSWKIIWPPVGSRFGISRRTGYPTLDYTMTPEGRQISPYKEFIYARRAMFGMSIAPIVIPPFPLKEAH